MCLFPIPGSSPPVSFLSQRKKGKKVIRHEKPLVMVWKPDTMRFDQAASNIHSMSFKALFLGLACSGSIHLANSQTYSIGWSTIDGGGGTSTGGVYAVSGTIGQPDAGSMSGGQFTLQGGFWALPVAVQDTNAPALLIVPDVPGKARVSWSPATPGFVLQESLSLSPASWTNAPSGATNPVVVPAVLPTKFYRLSKP
jgi:hypothetical protein